MSGDEALELKDLRDIESSISQVIAAIEKKDLDTATQELSHLSGLVSGHIMTGSSYEVHEEPARIREFLDQTPPDFTSAVRELNRFADAVKEVRTALEKTVAAEVPKK